MVAGAPPPTVLNREQPANITPEILAEADSSIDLQRLGVRAILRTGAPASLRSSGIGLVPSPGTTRYGEGILTVATARDGYRNTFIAVADDCTAVAEIPQTRGGKPTVATSHYELISENPYRYTQADILVLTALRQQSLPPSADTPEKRDEFFAKPRACLRSSPLGKKYGWGIHFDDKGRAAVHPADSPRYRELLADDSVKTVKALRSQR